MGHPRVLSISRSQERQHAAIDQEELAKIQELWDAVDADDSGELDKEEFSAVIEKVAAINMPAMILKRRNKHIQDSARGQMYFLIFLVYPGASESTQETPTRSVSIYMSLGAVFCMIDCCFFDLSSTTSPAFSCCCWLWWRLQV